VESGEWRVETEEWCRVREGVRISGGADKRIRIG
jgi:hypothetical protein